MLTFMMRPYLPKYSRFRHISSRANDTGNPTTYIKLRCNTRTPEKVDDDDEKEDDDEEDDDEEDDDDDEDREERLEERSELDDNRAVELMGRELDDDKLGVSDGRELDEVD